MSERAREFLGVWREAMAMAAMFAGAFAVAGTVVVVAFIPLLAAEFTGVTSIFAPGKETITQTEWLILGAEAVWAFLSMTAFIAALEVSVDGE